MKSIVMLWFSVVQSLKINVDSARVFMLSSLSWYTDMQKSNQLFPASLRHVVVQTRRNQISFVCCVKRESWCLQCLDSLSSGVAWLCNCSQHFVKTLGKRVCKRQHVVLHKHFSSQEFSISFFKKYQVLCEHVAGSHNQTHYFRCEWKVLWVKVLFRHTVSLSMRWNSWTDFAVTNY